MNFNWFWQIYYMYVTPKTKTDMVIMFCRLNNIEHKRLDRRA